jgi:alkylhydroperoxidase family enzyme
MPRRLQTKATWVDETLGNSDGSVSKQELAAYQRSTGADAGHLRTIAALHKQLDLERPSPARTVTVPVSPSSLTLTAEGVARALVKTGGRGTQADAEAVITELKKLPAALLERARVAGVQVVACRASITDHLTALRGLTPRGWPPGSTWDRVPGLYDPATMTVVMATHDGPTGERALPDAGYGHGSFNALFHELGHALDGTNALGQDSKSAEFRAAYRADEAALRAANQTYLLQPGDAGLEETYAEMAARHFSNDPTLPSSFPNLAAFFEARDASLRGGQPL